MSYRRELHLRDVAIGDVLYLRGLNERRDNPNGPPMVTITKAGPKRVGYVTNWGRTEYANRETRRVDDWHWLETVEQHETDRGRTEMIRTLKAAGIEPVMGADIGTALLARLVLALDEPDPPLTDRKPLRAPTRG